MTNVEYLTELVSEGSETLKAAFIEARGEDPYAMYAPEQKGVELAKADLFMHLIVLPEFTEGNLSVKYDTRSLKEAAQEIYKKYGDARYESGQPLIRSVKL